jgi:ABC-2 type transport system permease protein
MNILANPVLTRELRGRIRGNRALLILVIYLSIIAAVTLLVYAAAANTMGGGLENVEAGRVIGKTIFMTVMAVSLIQVCVITPSLTAGAISGEKERQSYDLLITTMLSPLQIALGKLTSALSFAMLLIMAALPMAALAFLFGGVSGTELLIGVLGLVVTAVCYATIGLFWSTVMRTTLTATVMAQGTVIMLLLAIPFLFTVGTILFEAFDGPPDALYIYGMGLLLSAHPFIALGMSAAFLAEGEGPLLVSLPSELGDLTLPSPWLVYIFISILLTILFLFLAVRLLRPVQYEARRKGKAKSEA